MQPLTIKSPDKFAAFVPLLVAGAIAGIVNVSYGIAFAAIIFSGNLGDYLATGIGLGLFSALVILVATTLLGTSPGVMTIVQEVPALLLSIIVANIAAELSPEQQLPTLLALLAVTSLLVGIVTFLLGTFRLGNWIRFIPYPVIGGFLAGTGWFISLGAMLMLVRLPRFSAIGDLLSPIALLQWIPGLGFAGFLVWLQRRYNHPLTLPGLLLGSLILFFGILGITHTSLAQVEALGLLMGPFASDVTWQPLRWETIAQAQWGIVAQQWQQLSGLVLVVLMAALLNITSLEVVVRREMSLNRELRAIGVANILSGLSGGLVGFHALGLSALCKDKIGSHSRWSGLLAAVMIGLVMLLGTASVAQMPRFVIGGLLLYLGLDFLIDWVWLARKTLPLIDYLIILAILFSMMVFGVLPAVGVGIVISTLSFLVNYSRLNIVRHQLTGRTLSSHMDREYRQQEMLRQQGEQIQVLLLQGYLFFGSAQQLLNRVRTLVEQDSPPQFIVLDFHQVSGIDSSVTYTFKKLQQTAPTPLRLVLAGLKPTHRRLLKRAGCLTPEDTVYHLADNLDQALEWCEEKLLETMVWRRKRFMPLAMLLDSIFSDNDQTEPFMHYLNKLELPADTLLFKSEEVADRLYFLEFGQVTTFFGATADARRQRTFGDGTVIGAIAFYQNERHGVTAIAQRPSILYVLTRDRWQAMLQEHPKAAAVFQEMLLKQLSGNLEQAQSDLNTLLF